MAVARHAARSVLVRRVRHLGCFFSADGEIDTAPLIERIEARGKTVWLPCLGQPTLRFRPYGHGKRLVRGEFGIFEPASGPFVTIRQLDVVFMPLVGFDDAGNRLGMGGGYYDRSLAFMRGRRFASGPMLVGLALALQRVAHITPQWWDIALDAVITEHGMTRFTRQPPDLHESGDET